jgi:hypothetical protein
VILKGKSTDSNLIETYIKSGYLVFASVFICLCVPFLTMLSFAKTIQYKGTELRAGRSQVQFPKVSLEVFGDIILPAVVWSWG